MKELAVDFSPKFSKRMGFFSKKGVSGTFTAVGGAFGMFAGEKRQMYYKGKGMTFDGFREYTPYDDAKMIDWKASLRANKKLVRKYSEEKNKNIVFFVDVSSKMSYASHFKLKNEYAAELIASLAYSFTQTGDTVGLVMFSEKMKKWRDPSVGEGQWLRICEELKNPENYEGTFNFTNSAEQLLSYMNFEAVVIIVSDFIGIESEPEWTKVYEILAARCEVLAIMIRDPLDNYVPKGIGTVLISSPSGGPRVIVNLNRIRDRYNETNAKFIDNFKAFNARLGVDMIMLTTDQDFVKPIMNFFIWREEVWR